MRKSKKIKWNKSFVATRKILLELRKQSKRPKKKNKKIQNAFKNEQQNEEKKSWTAQCYHEHAGQKPFLFLMSLYDICCNQFNHQILYVRHERYVIYCIFLLSFIPVHTDADRDTSRVTMDMSETKPCNMLPFSSDFYLLPFLLFSALFFVRRSFFSTIAPFSKVLVKMFGSFLPFG